MSDSSDHRESKNAMPFFDSSDLSALRVDELLKGVDCIDVEDCSRELERHAKDEGDDGRGRTLRFLAAVLKMHFRPHDPAEPFGPWFEMGDRRGYVPSDFGGRQCEELLKFATEVAHPGVKARLADIVWLNNRANGAAAQLAIRSYVSCVLGVPVDGSENGATESLRGPDHRTVELVRRAFQIARATKGKRDWPDGLLAVLDRLTQHARDKRHVPMFRRCVELRLDCSIGDDRETASEIELAAAWPDIDLFDKKELLESSRRAFRRCRDQEGEDRVQKEIAETTVAIAEASGSSAMSESSWLMTAIAEMRLVRGGDARRRVEELRLRLRTAQENVQFEMSTFSHEIDLTELANETLRRVEGLEWGEVLRQVACLTFSDDPDKLHEEAAKSVADNPLSSMFPSTVMDSEGKIVARREGLHDVQDQGGLLPYVAQNMSHRRRVMVSGMFEPVRHLILSNTTVHQRDFQFICVRSPFVPPRYEGTLALGFARLFQGDMVSAASILLPTLEASLRHVLKVAGSDTSKIESDLTQEDRSLSSLLEYSRNDLEAIFGKAITFEIDLLFNNRHGPALRHEHAHGKLAGGDFFSPDVVYGCWFLFHLTCIPLLGGWRDVAKAVNLSATGRSAVEGVATMQNRDGDQTE